MRIVSGGKAKEIMKTQPQTIAEWSAAVIRAQQEVNTARVHLQIAETGVGAELVECMLQGDETGAAKLRAKVNDAKQKLQTAELNLSVFQNELKLAQQRDVANATQTARAEIDRLTRELYQTSHTIRLTCQQLAKHLEAYQALGQELRGKGDEMLVSERARAGNKEGMPTSISVADYKPLFGMGDVLHLVALDLYVLTAGRWPHKNIGLDLYTISQGPRFDEHVRGYVRMLMKQLPGEDPQPPIAA